MGLPMNLRGHAVRSRLFSSSKVVRQRA